MEFFRSYNIDQMIQEYPARKGKVASFFVGLIFSVVSTYIIFGYVIPLVRSFL